MAVAVLMSRRLRPSGQPRTAHHPLRRVLTVSTALGRSGFLLQSSLTRLARLGCSMADNPTCDSTAQPDRVIASGTLIDFPNPDAWSGRRVLLGVAIGVGAIVAVFVGVFARSATSGTYISSDVAFGLGVALSFAVPLGVVAGFASRAARRRVDEVMAKHADGPLQEIFSALLVRSWFLRPTNVKRVAEALARQGRAGAAVRIAKPNRAAPIDPLIVPFEPMPLDEWVPLFVGLEQHTGTAQEETGAAQTGNTAIDEKFSRRGLQRRILLGGGWLMIAMFAFNAAIAGWEAYRARRTTFSAVIGRPQARWRAGSVS